MKNKRPLLTSFAKVTRLFFCLFNTLQKLFIWIYKCPNMKRKYSKKPAKQQNIARRRIDFLFKLAKDSFDNNQSKKYVKMAKRVAMKHKIRFNPAQKKMFCKNCFSYIIPGKNARVRLHKSRLIYFCKECKNLNRHPIK